MVSATVSKALNGYSDIGEETKNYILRTASEMGYLPNSSARALKTKRTLGVFVVGRSGLTHGLCGFHRRRGSGASPFRHSGGDHRSSDGWTSVVFQQQAEWKNFYRYIKRMTYKMLTLQMTSVTKNRWKLLPDPAKDWGLKNRLPEYEGHHLHSQRCSVTKNRQEAFTGAKTFG